MEKFDLFKKFIEQSLGKPLDDLTAMPVSGWRAVEALWPLNSKFKKNIHQIRSLPFDVTFCKEADAAIECLATKPFSSWDNLSAGAWRVLLERHQQAITVCLANELSKNPVMPLPEGLSPDQETVAVAIFLLHQMALPFPAKDRSDFELPPGSAKASLRLH
jgi:hypothetical protein